MFTGVVEHIYVNIDVYAYYWVCRCLRLMSGVFINLSHTYTMREFHTLSTELSSLNSQSSLPILEVLFYCF